MKLLNSISLLLILFSCQSKQSEQVLDVRAFQEKINSTQNAIVIDVRTPEEFKEGAIPNSQNINYKSDEFNTQINALDKNKNYFVYCFSGRRSSSAASYMRSNGFKNVYELNGGILEWKNNNLPINPPSPVAVEKTPMGEQKKD